MNIIIIAIIIIIVVIVIIIIIIIIIVISYVYNYGLHIDMHQDSPESGPTSMVFWVQNLGALFGLLSGNFLMATAGDANLGMSLNWMWVCLKIGYIPNEIAI